MLLHVLLLMFGFLGDNCDEPYFLSPHPGSGARSAGGALGARNGDLSVPVAKNTSLPGQFRRSWADVLPTFNPQRQNYATHRLALTFASLEAHRTVAARRALVVPLATYGHAWTRSSNTGPHVAGTRNATGSDNGQTS